MAPPVASVVAEPAGAAGQESRAAFVARLNLTDFRCYRALRLDLDASPVVLTGPNGAGKTNLLEALSFLAPGRGLRRAKLGEVDRRGADAGSGPWAVAAVLETAQGRVHIGTGREPADSERMSERRTVRIDGRPTRGQKDLAEHVAIVWLTPELDRLFLDGSSGRRRFVDRIVYGFHPEHAGEVSAYETVMRERARLLAEGTADAAWLDALEDGMARHGVAIAAARAAVVRRLDRAAAARAGQASPFPAARLSLAGEAEVASYAYERPDGSGYYREAKAGNIPIEGRVLAAASALAALRVARPWRDAWEEGAAASLMMAESAAGRYDIDVVRALLKVPRTNRSKPVTAPLSSLLSTRERDVLRWISRGASNKEVAQRLSISPSTVRTHVESVFRKLECSTRAAATLKATQLGLL